MRHLLILAAALASSSAAFAEGVSGYIRWGDFLGGYSHEVLIRDNTVVHVYRHEGAHLPDWNVFVLDASEMEAFLAKLSELGADHWAQRYPDEPNVCDGLSYDIHIDAPTLSVETEGGCAFPPRFDDVLDETKKLVRVRG